MGAFAAHGLRVRWLDQIEPADVAVRPEQTRAPLDIRRFQRDTGVALQYDLVAGSAAYPRSASELAAQVASSAARARSMQRSLSL